MPQVIRDYSGDGERWNITIKYIHKNSPLGTGGALGLLPDDEINESLIMMNGDLLTDINFEAVLDFHNQENYLATMCVREYDYQIPFGVVRGEGKKVRSMIEKPTERCFVNAGVYVLEPDLVKAVLPNVAIDMPTILEQKIEA